MRRVCEVALLGLVLACTDGGPEPDSWELVEADPSIEAHAGFQHQPERARLVDPNSQPRLELVARDYDLEVDGLCPFAVETRGFPAISEDGTTLVDAYGYTPNNSDHVDARMELTWLDVDRTRVDFVYNRSDHYPEAEDFPGCDAVLKGVRKQVAKLNTKLASRSWRSLESLDAFYSAPGFLRSQERLDWAPDEVMASLAGADRPIEVYFRNGHFIARVRGLRVLQDTPRPEWRLLEDEFCKTEAQIHAIDFDRATRLALVRYNYDSGACLCDGRDYVGRIELSAELLDAATQRSTAKFVAGNLEHIAAEEAG